MRQNVLLLRIRLVYMYSDVRIAASQNHSLFLNAIILYLYMIAGVSGVFIPDWGYGNGAVSELPPIKWSDRYPRCNGTRQSPISINASTAHLDGALTELEYYNYASRSTENVWSIINTGHVVLFSGHFKSSPIMHSAGLSIPYYFQQFHFHWGKADNRGSEHAVNGERYPLELHLVHQSHDGMDSWQPYDFADSSDSIGTAVIAILFELVNETDHDEKNVHLDTLFHTLAAATLIGDKPVNITLPDLTLLDLLPESKAYYRYVGSLTTPPCAEAVIWTVLQEPLKVTEEQLEIFRHLRETVEEQYPVETVGLSGNSKRDAEIFDNFRPLQDLNNRIVTYYPGEKRKTEVVSCGCLHSISFFYTTALVYAFSVVL